MSLHVIYFCGFTLLANPSSFDHMIEHCPRLSSSPILAFVRWRRSRSAAWSCSPETTSTASSTTPTEKCVAITPGRSSSWSTNARMWRKTGTPLSPSVQPSLSDSKFSPLGYPLFVCVPPPITHNLLGDREQRLPYIYQPL